MELIQRQIEALKLLKDWSAWMVTVQIGAIAFLGTAAKEIISASSPLFPFTIVCYSFSIIVAAWVLNSIPSIVVRLEGEKNHLHYKLYRSRLLPQWITLEVATTAQHIFFFLGMLGLLALLIWSRK